jgi:D-erythrulose 1-phosphate 3-epimerase
MKVTLGINNCFAVKRWPVADEWAQIVAESLALDVVQHSLDLTDLAGDTESDAAQTRRACSAHGLRIDSVFTGLMAYSTGLMLAPDAAQRQRGEAYWSAAIRFAAALGAQSVGGHVGSLSRRDADRADRRDALRDELRERLDRLGALAHDLALDALLIENMACDREPCRMSDFDDLLAPATDARAAIALCLDVGHQCVPGTSGDEADPYAWLAALGRQATVVHLQQSDTEGDHHWPFTAAYNERGRIRAPRVLEALRESGADQVTLVLEVIPAFEADDRRVLDELQESVAYWQQAIADFDPA